MAQELCKCGGMGTVERDGKLFECMCAYLRRRAADMPPHIRKADVLEGHLKLSVSKEVNKSLFILACWQDVKALIKLAMIRHPNLFLKVTSDSEILNVSLGKTSRSARGIEPEEAVYNSIQDLMDPPMLSIVRLNELHYKNKAASGYLEEALSYRLDRDKPTWVISDAENPYTQGCPAYSESVNDLIRSVMRKVEIPRITPRISLDASPLTPEPILPGIQSRTPTSPSVPVRAEGSPKTARETPREAPQRVRPVRVQSVPDTSDDEEENSGGLGMYGKGLKKPKPFGRD